MKVNTLLVVFSCLSILLLSGCATTYKSSPYGEPSPSLDVASILRLQDVPVPSGFTVLDGESFAFQNDVTRVALLKYIGSGPADLVVNFYKEQMPMYKWNPINIIEYDRRILNYEKESESCIITVEASGRKNIVIIAISPKSRPMKVELKTK